MELLVAPEDIEFAARDWRGACDAFHRHAATRSKETSGSCVSIATNRRIPVVFGSIPVNAKE
ncbi:hypothetical protein [Sinorhizobium meliloti]|uniref:hypothetical protein n=1 Tax=Rhizobium meliloti TaxID=382 RepID=UPI0013E30C54|nr:hypothetical protein [Sinorhizobium meliloti]QND29501.1 hypothetical protein HB773_31745 [Sinorhizobium meliloti]